MNEKLWDLLENYIATRADLAVEAYKCETIGGELGARRLDRMRQAITNLGNAVKEEMAAKQTAVVAQIDPDHNEPPPMQQPSVPIAPGIPERETVKTRLERMQFDLSALIGSCNSARLYPAAGAAMRAVVHIEATLAYMQDPGEWIWPSDKEIAHG